MISATVPTYFSAESEVKETGRIKSRWRLSVSALSVRVALLTGWPDMLFSLKGCASQGAGPDSQLDAGGDADRRQAAVEKKTH